MIQPRQPPLLFQTCTWSNVKDIIYIPGIPVTTPPKAYTVAGFLFLCPIAAVKDHSPGPCLPSVQMDTVV
jgi:hypothetical protein